MALRLKTPRGQSRQSEVFDEGGIPSFELSSGQIAPVDPTYGMGDRSHLPGALDTSYGGFALKQRALEALRMRNEARRAQAAEQGMPWMPGDEERPDPQGVWNVVLQGLQESAARPRRR